MADVITAAPPAPSKEDVAELVRRHGLRRAGARPPLGTYTRQLWDRRHFITAYATASNQTAYSRSFLGQLWQLLTPTLNIAVYYLVFGILLHTKRGVHDFIAFLAIGLFVFRVASSSISRGSRAIPAHLGLTRSLPFPRAVLPVSGTVIELEQLFYAMIVVVPILLITGEPIRVQWLEMLPVAVLVGMFGLGLAFIFARIGAHIPDTSQLLPFLIRVWMYLSGIMWSINQVAKQHAPWVRHVLDANPGAIFPKLARHALMTQNPVTSTVWLQAFAWSVGALIVGYIVFWHGEEEYGRV